MSRRRRQVLAGISAGVLVLSVGLTAPGKRILYAASHGLSAWRLSLTG